MVRRPRIVALDGPAGAGKSTVARAVARHLKRPYVDTGAMYRAAALRALELGLPLKNSRPLLAAVRAMRLDFPARKNKPPLVLMNGRDVTGPIRTPEVAQAASALATIPGVRKILVAAQRRAGRGGVVMEGRDIGTVVFPWADVKFYLDASAQARARRRWSEMRAQGFRPRLADIEAGIRERDQRDRTRAHSPLAAAPDAVVIDTTGYAQKEVEKLVMGWIARKARRQ